MKPKEAVDQAYERVVSRFKTEIGPILKDIAQEYEETTGYMIFDGSFELDDENNVEDVIFSREDR
jgi:hypothetical protein